MHTHRSPHLRSPRLRRWSRAALAISGALLLTPALLLFQVSAASGFANPAFQSQWQQGEAVTANFWGPLALAHDGQNEPYMEAPGGSRLVQYFDKARMELTNPSTGTVTNGLLAVELISGKLQAGDNTFQQFQPAAIPVAGDPNNAGPTYAQIGASGLMTAIPSAVGQPTTRALTGAGAASTFAAGGSDANATISSFDATTQHNVPKAFDDYRNKVGLLSIGLAIAEPFWANGVLVGGQPKDVLVQAFERRVLTYTPSNPDAFKVEFGNIGAHYYSWRYVTNAGGTGTATSTPTATSTTTTPTTTPTTPTTTPTPVLTQPTVTNITANKATVSYMTDVAACGTAEIRVKGDTAYTTNIDSISCAPSTDATATLTTFRPATTVTVTLTGLTPNTQYEVRGAAKVGAGPIGYSPATASFTTLAAQATADSYDGIWVNDTPDATGISRVTIDVTGNVLAITVGEHCVTAQDCSPTGTATFGGDPVSATVTGTISGAVSGAVKDNLTISFDDTRTHLKVVEVHATTNPASGPVTNTYTFHRLMIRYLRGAPITAFKP